MGVKLVLTLNIQQMKKYSILDIFLLGKPSKKNSGEFREGLGGKF